METGLGNTPKQCGRGVDHGLNSVLHEANAGLGHSSQNSNRAAQGDSNPESKPLLESKLPTVPSLTLPKGGGAIQGIGEKFNVNPSNGTGSLAVPIHTSSGRPGMQPALSLVYDSGSGNSEFGLGWSLKGCDSITRKTSKGLPQYNDGENSDVFILSGAEDLVPTFKKDAAGSVILDKNGEPQIDEFPVESYLVKRYMPRIVESHLRVEKWTKQDDLSDVHWRVTSTENVVTVFGSSNSTRIYNSNAGPDESQRIYSWLCAEAWDPQGNAIVFEYKREDSANVPLNLANEMNRPKEQRATNLYLKSIKYGNTIPNRDLESWAAFSAFHLAPENWKFSVLFDFGDHNTNDPKPGDTGNWLSRMDPFSHFRPGYEVRTYRLCQRVLIFHQFDELGAQDVLVSSTDFQYDENRTCTYLKSVESVGYMPSTDGGTVRRSLPPLDFTYSPFPTDEDLGSLFVQEVDHGSLENLPIGANGSNYRWIDLDGEGISGILAAEDQCWYYKRNLGALNTPPGSENDEQFEEPTRNARLGPLEILNALPSLLISSQGTHFGDVNGNGQLDIISQENSCWGYFERDDKQRLGWSEFRPFADYPQGIPRDRSMQFIDLTGDGLTDILILDDQVFHWHNSKGLDGYRASQSVTQPNNEINGPVCVFADSEQTIHLADMSGDGMVDLVRIKNGTVCYWPNLGYGRFGNQIHFDNSPRFDHDDQFNHTQVRIADIDGSGTSDVLYCRVEGIDIYMNQSGNSFSDVKKVLFPQFNQHTVLDTVDLLGSGTTCLVWSSSLPTNNRTPMRYVDLCRGRKPHLLTKILNNIGSETNINYASSTKFYLQDRLNNTPWITRLPFPVQCVESMETVDRISGNRFKTQYRYKHGFYDGLEREFRGFARVEQVDSTTFSAKDTGTITNSNPAWKVPPIRTVTWFHTGAYIDRENVSQLLSREYFQNPNFTESSTPDGRESLLRDTRIPDECIEGFQQREACRCLKGKVIRTEVYTPDGTDKEKLPYSVQQANFSIVPIQPLQDGNAHGVYQIQGREAVSIHYDRSLDDPRVTHTMALETDPYGNNKKDLKIAYGRVSTASEIDSRIQDKQKLTLIVYQENAYTNPLLGADYRTPLPCEARQYEISGLEPSAPGLRFRYEDMIANAFSQLLSIQPSPYEAEKRPGQLQRRLLQRERVCYRKDDMTDLLPLGKIESLALPGKKYELAFSPGLVLKLYQKKTSIGPTSIGPVNLIANVNELFGGGGASGAGYVDIDNDSHWWKPTGRIAYAALPNAGAAVELAEARQSFFMPKGFVDLFGNETSTQYDKYKMFPVATEDALKNKTTINMDYRVLQPSEIIDPNANHVAAKYDALGMLSATAVMGKPADSVGDTVRELEPNLSQDQLDAYFADPSPAASEKLLGKATTRVVYDLWRKQRTNEPIYSVLIAREDHVNGPVPPDGRKFQVAFTYSDGFGRVIQSKARTKSGPLLEGGPVVDNLWVGTGWTVFNNKGNPVKQFEPFFDKTHKFQSDMIVGVSPTFFYDPVGRVVATMRPDHAISKAVFTPWSEAAFDVNDTVKVSDPRMDPDVGFLFQSLPPDDFLPSWYDARAGGQLGREEQDAAMKAAAHDQTPKKAWFDPLGRPVLVENDNGTEKLTASIDLDIQGNAISNRDALGRMTMNSAYDMCSRRICTASIDAGEAWILHDAQNHALMRWNSRDFRFRFESDQLRRVARFWIQEGNVPEILYQENIFGEKAPNAEGNNLRGKIWKVRDQAGVVIQDSLDFKGNLTNSSRQFHESYRDLLDLSQTVQASDKMFSASSTYDALNRPVRSIAPDGSITFRVYDQTTKISQMYVNIKGEQDSSSDYKTWTPMLLDCQYNPHGQAIKTQCGNGVTVFRSYDRLLHRLQNIRTVRKSGDVLQDLIYTYDAVGNVTNIRDNSQQTIYFRNTKINPSSSYLYDPTYRLISATGREHLGQTGGKPVAPGAKDDTHVNETHPGDGNAMGNYAETYRYDKAGNILSMQHSTTDAQAPGWTRNYSYDEFDLLEQGVKGNRLSSTTVGSVTETYRYEGLAGLTGNMTSMSSLPIMKWDYAEQLRATSRQVVNSGTPEMTYYVYDSQGTRVRKITESQAGSGSTDQPVRLKETIYLGDLDIIRKYKPNGIDLAFERTTFHVGEGAAPLARIERRTQGTDDRLDSQIRFQLTNLLGSVCVELDHEGKILSYEEYFPFGSTSYQATPDQTEVPKRYRYTNKELDTENGLYYFGGRYYAAWLGRWTSCDPAAGPRNCYDFVTNNPIHLVDPDGNQTQTAGGGGASFSNQSGVKIHTILTYVLRGRLALMGVHSAGPVPTLPGGSKNNPNVTNTPNPNDTRGVVDIAPLAPMFSGQYMAHVYEIKPEAQVPRDSTAYRKSSETQLYAKQYPLGRTATGQDVVGAKVGTMLEDLAAINPSLMAPVSYSNADVDIEIKMNLPPDTQRPGVKTAGLVTYTLSITLKNKKANKETKALEALDQLIHIQQQQGLPQVAPLPHPVIYPKPQGVAEPQPGVQPAPQEQPVTKPDTKPEEKPKINLDHPPANDNGKEEQSAGSKAAKIGLIIIGIIGGIIIMIETGGGAFKPAPAGFGISGGQGPIASGADFTLNSPISAMRNFSSGFRLMGV